MIELMYITNRPEVALIAQKAGVQRIWIDMEWMGKEERQKNMNTVKNHHTIEDIRRMRPYITKSQLLTRINPIHDNSFEEINAAIDAGTDLIMLPMFKTPSEVQRFVTYVDKRAKTILLLETKEAICNLDSILEVQGIDEIHIGINDLSISYGMDFMFQCVSEGVVERACRKIAAYNIPYGFGGIARLGYGVIPAEYVIAEHYRIGSTRAILSRSFCDANKVENPHDVEDLFISSLKDIRAYEKFLEEQNEGWFINNKNALNGLVHEAVNAIRERNR